MSQTVTKIFGPPGTGKTTRLLNLVDEAIQAGVRPERIAFMAFTRKAATEAATRAKTRFNLTDDQLQWFRTLHSMAFKLIGARRDDIMQESHYKELGRVLGFQFTSIDDEFTLMPVGTALGDRAARVEALSRVRQVSLEQQWQTSNFQDVPWLAVRQWSEGLQRYKQSRGMMDYTDLLEQFDEPLDVDVFIVDEAQDLSPLQWSVALRAAANAKHFYVAGDDDQCIYDWAGADNHRFLRMQANHDEVLPVSFRLPRKVFRLADSVTQRILIRKQKQWTPKPEDGAVERLGDEQALPLRKGTWMLLARNHSTLARYERVLRSFGYPYEKEGRHSTANNTTRAIMAWEHWRRGNPLQPQDIRQVAAVHSGLTGFKPSEATFITDAPLTAAQRKQTWMDALSIKPEQREYLRACLANKESLTAKPRIVVSTIHRVKGGEAQHVALIPDLSHNPWKQLNTDSENRVLYVALTRASESLTIIRPQSNRHYQI